jgi:hypothetical protein
MQQTLPTYNKQEQAQIKKSCKKKNPFPLVKKPREG